MSICKKTNAIASKNNESQASEICEYFDEDVVWRFGKNGKVELGIVTESCENASDDESDSEDEDWKRLKPGFAKVAWHPLGNTQVINEKKVKLFDRALLPGDVIRRKNSNVSDERGYCKNVKVSLTLQIMGTNKVISNVDFERIEPLFDIAVDTVCLYESWIGYINEIKYSITLKCYDGSLVIVTDDMLEEFDDVFLNCDLSSEFDKGDYYVGQHLSGPKKHLRSGNWIFQTDEMKSFMETNNRRNSNTLRVVVENVKIASVAVNWMYSLSRDLFSKSKHVDRNTKDSLTNKCDSCSQVDTSQNNTNSYQPPGDLITGDDVQHIRSLNYFEKCSLQIGDHVYLTINENDRPITLEKWKEVKTNDYQKDKTKEMSKGHRSRKKNDGINLSETESENSDFEDIDSISTKDQNDDTSSAEGATMEKRMKYGKKNYPIVFINKIKKKRLRATQKKMNLPINLVPGARLPVEIIATESTVSVVWQSGTIEENISSKSLYPVHHLDNHDFFPGDFVILQQNMNSVCDYGIVQSVDHMSRVAKIKWVKLVSTLENTFDVQTVKEEVISVYDLKDHSDYHYRPGCCVIKISASASSGGDSMISRAGQVIDTSVSEQLECVWVNGEISNVYPQDLCVIGEYDSDDLWDEEFDFGTYSDRDNESISSWATESEHYVDVDSDFPSPTTNSKDSGISPQLRSNKKSGEIKGNENMIETLRNAVVQLEDWLGQNSPNNHRVAVSAMQKIFKMCRNVRSLEEQLGSIPKLRDLQNQASSMKNSSGAIITGKFQHILSRLSKLLSSNEMCRSSPSTERPNFNNTDVNGDNSTPSTSSSLSNEKACLEFLENLKVDLFNSKGSEEQNKNESFSNGESSGFGSDSKSESGIEYVEEQYAQLFRKEKFMLWESVHEGHKFVGSSCEPSNPSLFFRTVKKEISLLKSSLPEGIIVKGFDNRTDLYSAMIIGPKGSPYEDGLFFFDIQLPPTYPTVPPQVHYISFCSDRLNPNLYESGKVCVSLLGTWSGRGTEVWTTRSSLLQVIISIQGLILVPEPYYNEAGYLKQKGSSSALENSKLYNEMVIVKMLQSMANLLKNPIPIFREEIESHFMQCYERYTKRIEGWIQFSQTHNSSQNGPSTDVKDIPETSENFVHPEFPLLPGSVGFCLSTQSALTSFKNSWASRMN